MYGLSQAQFVCCFRMVGLTTIAEHILGVKKSFHMHAHTVINGNIIKTNFPRFLSDYRSLSVQQQKGGIFCQTHQVANRKWIRNEHTDNWPKWSGCQPHWVVLTFAGEQINVQWLDRNIWKNYTS